MNLIIAKTGTYSRGACEDLVKSAKEHLLKLGVEVNEYSFIGDKIENRRVIMKAVLEDESKFDTLIEKFSDLYYWEVKVVGTK